MVQRRYTGVRDPRAEFEKIRPAVAVLDEMLHACKPFGQDYLILSAAREGLVSAAFHFTREPYFYGSKPMRA